MFAKFSFKVDLFVDVKRLFIMRAVKNSQMGLKMKYHFSNTMYINANSCKKL